MSAERLPLPEQTSEQDYPLGLPVNRPQRPQPKKEEPLIRGPKAKSLLDFMSPKDIDGVLKRSHDEDGVVIGGMLVSEDQIRSELEMRYRITACLATGPADYPPHWKCLQKHSEARRLVKAPQPFPMDLTEVIREHNEQKRVEPFPGPASRPKKESLEEYFIRKYNYEMEHNIPPRRSGNSWVSEERDFFARHIGWSDQALAAKHQRSILAIQCERKRLLDKH